MRFSLFFMAFACSVGMSMAQFTATMSNVVSGEKRIYQVSSDGEKYRYDFVEDGVAGIVIVEPLKSKTAILMPGKKYVHYTETSSVESRSNDPVQALLTIKDRYEEKKLEKEEIAGFNCFKSELFAGDQKVFTLWFSEELNFPLRIEKNFGRYSSMELSDIKIRDIDANRFIVPQEYTEVDDRMRPIIPEPPPPESWTNIELSMPVDHVLRCGEKVILNISETKNYRMTAVNNTDNPAKYIRSVWKDGSELPEGKQGPLQNRTKRIFSGEQFSNVYYWKAGEQVQIEIHEGELQLQLDLENRSIN